MDYTVTLFSIDKYLRMVSSFKIFNTFFLIQTCTISSMEIFEKYWKLYRRKWKSSRIWSLRKKSNYFILFPSRQFIHKLIYTLNKIKIILLPYHTLFFSNALKTLAHVINYSIGLWFELLNCVSLLNIP